MPKSVTVTTIGDAKLNLLEGCVNVEEAAKFLGVSPRRVRQFINPGKGKASRLPAFRIGSNYLIQKETLYRFAEIKRKAGRPPQSG